jgi:hypothetical protein
MSVADRAQAAMKAWEFHDVNTFASYLADDFVCKGPLPQPLNKEQYSGYMKAMMTAMPDWSFNAHLLHEQGTTVLFVTQITGTHTGDLSVPGLPIILPQARKSLSLTNIWSTPPTVIQSQRSRPMSDLAEALRAYSHNWACNFHCSAGEELKQSCA